MGQTASNSGNNAPGSASGSRNHNEPPLSCKAMCEVHCPEHPNYQAKIIGISDLWRYKACGGIPIFGQWTENPSLDFNYSDWFDRAQKRRARGFPIFPGPDPETHIYNYYNGPQNPNANDKKPDEIATASTSSESNENPASAVNNPDTSVTVTGSQTESGPESSSNHKKGFRFPWSKK